MNRYNLPNFLYSPLHKYCPGDSVWVKECKNDPLGLKWRGPYLVLLSTPTAVKVAEVVPWMHHSRLKAAAANPDPEWRVIPSETSPLRLKLKKTVCGYLPHLEWYSPSYGELHPVETEA
uniref:Murine leukemia virus integrase C-terminal domain-containing protein n=1 Tax=Leptobrachium leishanense TaxID=445787 RepID=A0A8C5QCJ3_9ANUR